MLKSSSRMRRRSSRWTLLCNALSHCPRLSCWDHLLFGLNAFLDRCPPPIRHLEGSWILREDAMHVSDTGNLSMVGRYAYNDGWVLCPDQRGDGSACAMSWMSS